MTALSVLDFLYELPALPLGSFYCSDPKCRPCEDLRKIMALLKSGEPVS
jgi:hypothetical protein